MKRKVLGIGLAAAVLLAGFGLAGSASPAEAAGPSWWTTSSGEVYGTRASDGGSWFDTHVFQRGCRAHQPGCPWDGPLP